MAWTKGDILTTALSDLAVAGYAFDLQPEETQACINKLDQIMAEKYGLGLSISYNRPTGPNISVGTDASGLDEKYIYSVTALLAREVCSMFGRPIPPQVNRAAIRGERTMLAMGKTPPIIPRPITMPIGAGNKSVHQQNYFNEET